MKKAVVSVLLPDRVGILRDVTRVVFGHGGNIMAIRQTIVHGFFNLVFTVVFDRDTDRDTVSKALSASLDDAHAVTVREFAEPPPVPLSGGASYIVTTRGPDRPGTVYAISRFFVEHGINITDWMVSGDEYDTIYMAEVVLPPDADFCSVRDSFRSVMAERGLKASICHTNIFRATSEIGAIQNLLAGVGK